jgi:predicted transcriptional regulator
MPIAPKTTESGRIIAKALMKSIQYDNGMVDRWNPERYPTNWVNRIGNAAELFFDKNPAVKLCDETIDEISTGEDGELTEKYGQLEGYKELNTVLNRFFDAPRPFATPQLVR